MLKEKSKLVSNHLYHYNYLSNASLPPLLETFELWLIILRTDPQIYLIFRSSGCGVRGATDPELFIVEAIQSLWGPFLGMLQVVWWPLSLSYTKYEIQLVSRAQALDFRLNEAEQ